MREPAVGCGELVSRLGELIEAAGVPTRFSWFLDVFEDLTGSLAGVELRLAKYRSRLERPQTKFQIRDVGYGELFSRLVELIEGVGVPIRFSWCLEGFEDDAGISSSLEGSKGINVKSVYIDEAGVDDLPIGGKFLSLLEDKHRASKSINDSRDTDATDGRS